MKSKFWGELPESEWNERNIGHFLRRSGFAATKRAIAEASKLGMKKTVDRVFAFDLKGVDLKGVDLKGVDLKGVEFKEDEELRKFRAEMAQIRHERRNMFRKKAYKNMSEAEKKKLRERRQEFMKRNNELLYRISFNWLSQAAEPRKSAREKLTLFFQDVYVVGLPKTKSADWLHEHQSRIRQNLNGSAPQMTRAMLDSPALAHYLDLQKNKKDKPNENFARELFELFTLGEGNYSEVDIKEAARALAGFRLMKNADPSKDPLQQVKRLSDQSRKRIFGKLGHWDADDLVKLIYEQDAAATFLPKEMLRFYLSEEELSDELIEDLGNAWRAAKFSIPFLIRSVFQSKLFYDKKYHKQSIKSPIQYYLGLTQELQISPVPIRSFIRRSFKSMGQEIFAPPNVRGWVGGKKWINTATLFARSNMAAQLFNKIKLNKLNADDIALLQKGRQYWVSPRHLNKILDLKSPELSAEICELLLNNREHPYKAKLDKYLASKNLKDKNNRDWFIRHALIAVIQSPEYNLC